MILITGATGGIGSELCKLLADAAVPARAMYRKQEQLAQFTKMGIEAVKGDFEDTDSLKLAMQGCDQLFLLTQPSPNQESWEKTAIDLAVNAGIKNIVKISAGDANLSTEVPWARSHAKIDHYLRKSGIGWTIIRPSAFFQNFLKSAKVIAKGILPQVTGKGQACYIDLRDIALVAKHTLIEKHHQGAVYYLTGNESLTMKDIAVNLSKATGCKIRFVNIPVFVMYISLMLSGVSKWMAKGLIEQFNGLVRGGYDMDVTEEVERITGRLPRTFLQFAKENKEKFV